jgi:hypothetical protein
MVNAYGFSRGPEDVLLQVAIIGRFTIAIGTSEDERVRPLSPREA